jgi:GNAT superfamily N-acetyltransferase
MGPSEFMKGVVVRRARPSDSKEFLRLLVALAEFERLEPPSRAGRLRILADLFRRRRIYLLVAAKGKRLVGYALYFYTYSSFNARPSLYLEDLFVDQDYREGGVGLSLLKRCAEEAVKKGCARMEWMVLAWNKIALGFYQKLGARSLEDWRLYRLDGRALARVARKRAKLTRGPTEGSRS